VQEPQPTAVAPPVPTATLLPGRSPTLRQRLRSPSRLRSLVDYAALAAVAFVPMLASQPGVVSDDTKTYLYLDPGRYVRQAASLWDPSVGLGTVTHENIGYLLPMGPYFWVMAELHVPLWVAQRLWMGALLFAAGAGALYLCRTIGLHGPGRYVAALGYMYTPYVLQYAGRISVILMPWAGLPWMIAFVILAVRRPGWRYPALFALVVALVSGINASSLLYVGIAPALFLPYVVLVVKEATWRRVWGVAWRTGLLTALVSLWWAVGLQIEAAYGVNVLKYTETVPATSGASLASEIVRGLGYWYFYGSDRLGSWTQSSVQYTQNVQLIALSFFVPALCFVAAFFSRWRYRSYFIVLTVVGMVLAVGPNPYTDPSLVGRVLRKIMVDTTAGLAMRSTDRASPVIILSLAMFLGAGVSAVYARARRTGLVVWLFAAAAIVAATAPLWTGAIVANGFYQPASPPDYVHQAAAALDTSHPGTRVYAIPGNDFAAYRWGDTIDTVYPGLMTRPFATHEQQVMGSIATADLLQAVDTPLQDGTINWNSLAPMASLMSAGDVLVQYDQAYERYDTPIPQEVAAQLSTTPPGLSNPVTYGTPRPNVPLVPHVDEATLALPANPGWPPPLTSYTVDDPRPIVRAESTSDPLVVAGDASGLVNASSVGLLQGNPTVVYSGTLDTHATLQHQTLGHPAELVITDTNRKQGYRWNSLNENLGYTETASQPPDTADPTDAPIDLFPKAPADAQTTATYTGVSSVTASSYGSSITYLPEHQPSAALDGNTQTSWLTDSFTNQLGQWWQVALAAPVSENAVALVQPQTGDPDRWITSATLTFDGGNPVTVALGPASRAPTGQLVTFSPRTFSTLRITVDTVAVADRNVPVGSRSSVGFAEVGIPGISVDESIAMPDDLLRTTGPTSLFDRLSLVMTRLRSSGTPPRSDIEGNLARSFWLPTTRTFSLTGSARISALIPDDQIDRMVGRSGSSGSGIVAYSIGRLPGDLRAGAIATLDGDPSTVWEPGFGATHQAGDWLAYSLPRPITFDHLDLQVLADGRHSVPTEVTVSTDSGSATVPLPPIADSQVAGSTVAVPVSFPTLHGQSIRITFDAVRLLDTPNYYSKTPIALPIGVAEVGIPGLHAAPVPANIPASCRHDVLSVDGNPVWVVVSGTTAAALDRQALTVSLCGPDAGGLTLGPGAHTLTSTLGQLSGFDVDQLALDSAPGGGPMPLSSATTLAAPSVAPAPQVAVTSQHATSLHLAVTGIGPRAAATPFDLVLGESINSGWRAAVVGGPGLGAPTLIDGFANGWRVDPAALGGALRNGTLRVVLSWHPQQEVNVALLVSAAAIIACLLIVLLPKGLRRRRKRRMHALRPPEAERFPEDGPVLAVPFRAEASRAPVWVGLLAGLVAGALATAVATPPAGIAVGAATLLVLLVPRLRVLLAICAIAGIVAAGVYTAVHQAQFHIPPDGAWTTNFETASRWAWAGVVFLGADGVVDIVLRRRRAKADASPDPDTG
jgi:arabinofuranan 3-O-arabinosyltransferase